MTDQPFLSSAQFSSTRARGGVLAAVAPIIGTPRVVAATGNILRALGFALDMAELEEAAE